MTELISKLTKDLRWRLSSAGSKFRPKPKEIATWAPVQIPAVVVWLAWPVVAVALILAVESLHNPGLSDAMLPLLILLTPLVLYWLRGLAGRAFIVRAYSRLLRANERFTLVEYSKYLRRQIERARTDPVLGGEPEVRRLTELLQRFNALLQQGIGEDGRPTPSALAEEAELAEALVQTYEERRRNPLEALDARLSPELRQRVAELEREAGPPRPQRQAE